MNHELDRLAEARHRLINGEAGNSEEDHELELWGKFLKDEERGIEPNVFKHLQLAQDGGFTEVNGLYTHTRWLSGLLLVAFVFYNIGYLCVADFQLLTSPEDAVATLMPTGTPVATVEAVSDNVLNSFYFSQYLTDGVWSLMGQTTKLEPVSVLGLFELLGVAYFMLSILACLYRARYSTGFKKWFGIQNLFWDVLPTLSSYSAMKLLNSIVPAVLTMDALTILNTIQEGHAERDNIDKKTGKRKGNLSFMLAIADLIDWIIKIFFFFIFGFDTFLMKLRIVSGFANSPDASITIVLPCVQFLIQVLGIVQLGPFVRKRLFLFIFGGEDGIMQQEEKELMETWSALLARRIYKEYVVEMGSWLKFLAVMLSFADADFQQLVLNEDNEAKIAHLGT